MALNHLETKQEQIRNWLKELKAARTEVKAVSLGRARLHRRVKATRIKMEPNFDFVLESGRVIYKCPNCNGSQDGNRGSFFYCKKCGVKGK